MSEIERNDLWNLQRSALSRKKGEKNRLIVISLDMLNNLISTTNKFEKIKKKVYNN